MTRIDLALVICNQGEDREKAVAALLKCGLSPNCCSNLQEARTLLCQPRWAAWDYRCTPMGLARTSLC